MQGFTGYYWDYKGIKGITRANRLSQEITGDYKGLQDYRGLHRFIRGQKGLQQIRRSYRGLQGITPH